jgi:transposase InsO family protein
MSCAEGLCPAHRACDAAQDARSLKYEDIYLKDYASVAELEARLCAYFVFYNTERPHQGLGYLTPAEVHFA